MYQGVYRDHPVVFGDDCRVVHIGAGIAFHGRVLVHELQHFLVSLGHGEDVFAGVEGFLFTGYHSLFYEVYHSGPNTSVCIPRSEWFSSCSATALGSTPYTHLDGGTIGY